MMVVAGQTLHFVVSYDDSITLANGYPFSGLDLAQAVLNSCEGDLNKMSNLFGGIMPAPASLPFQINLVPGGGGASHPGCLATMITCYISHGSDTLGVPALVDAEVAEVFMATQGQGVNCGYSNGEALSRVLPTVLYPNLKNRFATGNSWLNSVNPPRPDWVNNTEQTDQSLVSIGCGSLFLNYLAYQLNFSWPAIIAAGAPTLGQTAANLGLQNAFNNFAALLARHFPPNVVAQLPDDDPFPLAGDPCQTLCDQVNELSDEIDNLIEAVNSGELPPPPRTPERVAMVMRYIHQLQRRLRQRRLLLDQCRQLHPDSSCEA
jgi:hypothetical protein